MKSSHILNFHIARRAWFQAMYGSTAKPYKILFVINTNSVSRRAAEKKINSFRKVDWLMSVLDLEE